MRTGIGVLAAALALIVGCAGPSEFGAEGWVAGRVVFCRTDTHCSMLRTRRTVYIAARMTGSGSPPEMVAVEGGQFGFHCLPGRYTAVLQPRGIRGRATTQAEFVVRVGATTKVTLAYR